MCDFFMETERLGFARWEAGDEPLALALWGDPQVSRYITAGGVFSKQQVLDRLRTELGNQENHGVQYWPLFFKGEAEAFVGCCGLRPFPQEENGFETGVQLLPAYWGQGLACEAERAVVAYAFSVCGAAALFAGHHPENQGSRRMMAKLGFQCIGERFYPPTGLMHPAYQYTRDSFDKGEAQKREVAENH